MLNGFSVEDLVDPDKRQGIIYGLYNAVMGTGSDSADYSNRMSMLTVINQASEDLKALTDNGGSAQDIDDLKTSLEGMINAYNQAYGGSLTFSGVMGEVGKGASDAAEDVDELQQKVDEFFKAISSAQSSAQRDLQKKSGWADYINPLSSLMGGSGQDLISAFGDGGMFGKGGLFTMMDSTLMNGFFTDVPGIEAVIVKLKQAYELMAGAAELRKEGSFDLADIQEAAAFKIMTEAANEFDTAVIAAQDDMKSLVKIMTDAQGDAASDTGRSMGWADQFYAIRDAAGKGEDSLIGWMKENQDVLKEMLKDTTVLNDYFKDENGVLTFNGSLTELIDTIAMLQSGLETTSGEVLPSLFEQFVAIADAGNLDDSRSLQYLKDFNEALFRSEYGAQQFANAWNHSTKEVKSKTAALIGVEEDLIDEFAETGDASSDAAKKIQKAISNNMIKHMEKLGQVTAGTTDVFDALAGSGEDVAAASVKLQKNIKQAQQNQYDLNQVMGGATKGSDEYNTALQNLMNSIGIVDDSAESLALAQAIVSGQMDAASESATWLANELFVLAGEDFDASGWQAQLAKLMASEDAAVSHTATLVNSLLKLDGTTVSAGADGKIRVRLGGGGGYNTKKGSSGSKSGGGGGGSSSKQKSEIEQMIDLMDQIQSFYAHRNKLIKSTQNYYQTSGELTNLIHAYEQEREELEANNKVLEDNLAKITPLLEAKEKEAAAMDSSASEYEQVEKDLKALQKAHMQYTEELADNKTAVLELNKAIKDQRDAIRSMEIELRETILKAIEDREELNERMLQGTIDVENEILNIIKKRYEDERDAIKKTAEAKKDALEAEKDLLDKQLSDRKKLADQEEKQLKLTQLEAKLARIAADPTRSKEALDLRKQIAELRKDMAWDLAEDEVDAQKESIDQQIDSLEDYIEYVEDYYEELFKHPQKLIQEMREIIVKSDTEIMEWLKHNSEEYAASTEATQQSMTKGWQDMLDDMHGSIKTYWDEVEQIIAGGDDAIINFLKANSADYKAAGKLQAEAYVDEWKKQIEDLKKAYKDAYEYANSFDYSSIKTYTGSTGGGSTGGGAKAPKGYQVYYTVAATGKQVAQGSVFATQQEADAQIARIKSGSTYKAGTITDVIAYPVYKKGGMADFTGPAWLDGSPSAPERILSPLQTQLFEDMVASLQQIKVKVPSFFTPDGIQTGTAGQNFAFGDINISVDSLDNDADLNDLAERIKEHIMDSLARGSVVGGIRMTR